MIRYEYLNQAGLTEFLSTDEYRHMPYLPISRHRAESHLHNPRLDADDILLILAYENDDMLGYLGILPDHIYPSGQQLQYGCLSCLWITPAGRGKGLGSILLKKGVEAWGGLAMLSDYVPRTAKIYQRAGVFNPPIQKTGIRLYIRMDMAYILPPKKKIFLKMKPLLKLGDRLSNLFLDIRFVATPKLNPNISIEYIDQIDDECVNFISPFLKHQLIRRGREELNWMLDYPWVLSGRNPDQESRRYYFSSVDASFRYHCVKVRQKEGPMIGFLMFMERNKHLKLPYAYFQNENIDLIVKVIEHLIQVWRVNTFTTFSPNLVEYWTTHKAIGLYKKTVERNYILSNGLAQKLSNEDFDIMDGDLDDGFT